MFKWVVLCLTFGLLLTVFSPISSCHELFKSKYLPFPLPKTTEPKPQSPKTSLRTTTVNGVRYYALQDIAHSYGLPCSENKVTALMGRKGMCMTFTYEKRLGAYNGTQFALLFAPIKRNQLTWISQYDYQYIVQPMLNARNMSAQRIKTICIDPGHGGKDPGGRGRNLNEASVNLALAKLLQKKLTAMGYKVIMTRQNNTFVELSKRAEIANAAKADLFLSIHCNATRSSTIRGVETYAMTPRYCASTSENKPVSTAYKGNRYDKNNFRFAYELQRALRAGTAFPDRGVKHARFAVLRNVHCPAALIEIGFLTNRIDEKDLGSPALRDRLAIQLCNAILRYHKAVKR